MASRTPQLIRIMTAALVPHDAIGNDVIEMARALSAGGYAVSIIAGSVHPKYRDLARPLARVPKPEWASPNEVLIYHHSMGWPEGEEIAATTRNRLVVRYHNITPPEFFDGYSEPHTQACKRGRTAMIGLARTPGTWFWGDSAFNCSEMIEAGAPQERCRVLPPLREIADLTSRPFDFDVLREYRDGCATVLFVGGMKPNKGHKRAIRVFADYHWNCHSRSRLVLLGRLEPQFRGYLDQLHGTAAELGVERQVVFRTSATAEELRTFYLLADAFLSMSEHEGFCVPLVESMYFRVPIVALAATAVPETVGECGILWSDADNRVFAASIDACVEDLALARRMREAGWRRYQSVYRVDRLRRRLLDLVKDICE